MGMRKSSKVRTTIHIPLRLDRLARELCHCLCHSGDSPHRKKSCPCIPTYGVDGHALSVVQYTEREVTNESESSSPV